MKYKGVTLLKRNLTPSFDTGFSHDVNDKILDRLVAWAEKKNTKTIAVERLIRPGEAFELNVDEVIKIGVPGIGNIEFGVWKVYGDPHMKENPRGRHRYLDWKKQTEEAAEQLAKKQKKNPRDESFFKKLFQGKLWDNDKIDQTQISEELGFGYKYVDKKWKDIPITDRERIIEHVSSTSPNPRKKEMKMGTPDKKVSLFKIMEEIDETPNEYRFRMQPPSKFQGLKYGKKSITKGVRAIYGCPKAEWAPRLEKCKKGMAMQSLRLSKDIFHSKTEAAGWIARHTKPRRE